MLKTVKNTFKNHYISLAFICAVIHFTLGNLMMKDFYPFRLSEYFQHPKWMLIRIMFFGVLLLVYSFVFWGIIHFNKKWFYYTLFLCGINLLVLLLVWPGVWRWDEFFILREALNYSLKYWQHYITSLWYIFSIMMIPTTVAPILVMIAINSTIGGYILYKATCLWGKWGSILMIPFLFFSVLDSNMYPMRLSIFAFLELLLVVRLLEYLFESRTSFLYGGFELAFLAALITVWRTEAIYFIFCFPLLVWLIFRKKYENKKICLLIIFYFFITVMLLVPQLLGNMKDSNDDYDLTSTVLPIVPLVVAAENGGEISDLESIDQVLDVNILLQGEKDGKNGIEMFWAEKEFVREYNSEQYAQYKKAYYRLITKYPGVFLKERWGNFLHTGSFVRNTTAIYDDTENPMYKEFIKRPGAMAFNSDLRKRVISILECKEYGAYQTNTSCHAVIYNVMLPIGFMFICIGLLLSKKKWKIACIFGLPLIGVLLIFLTAPATHFMYYYPIYLIGYMAIFAFIADSIFRRKIKKDESIES